MEGTTYTVNEYEPRPGDIMVYITSLAGLREFMKKPSLETIFMNSSVLDVYRKSESRVDFVEVERIFGPTLNWQTAKSGSLRIGSWPVYTEFIDFLSNTENIRQILLERDINEEIISYVIIQHGRADSLVTYSEGQTTPSNTPTMCLWIHTDAGDYFLEHYFNLDSDPLDTNWAFQFQTFEEYSLKYGA